MQYPVAIRIDRSVALASAFSLDLFRAVPARARKVRAFDPAEELWRGAHWDFGPDADSLDSLTSGHRAAAAGTVTWSDEADADGIVESVLTPDSQPNQGIDLAIPGMQTATWWVVAKHNSTYGGDILGNRWSGTKASGFQIRFATADPWNVEIRAGKAGATNSSINNTQHGWINAQTMPAGADAGDWFLIFLALGAAGMEGYVYGSTTTRSATAGHTPDTALNVAAGALYVPDAAKATNGRGVRIAEIGCIKDQKLSKAAMDTQGASIVARMLSQKGIMVRAS